MGQLYDQLKLDLKKQTEYQRELELEIAFLNKQCTMARNRALLLNEEI